MKCHTNHVYDPTFAIEFVGGNKDRRAIKLNGRRNGGFAGKPAIIVADHLAIDGLNALFEVTHQVAGNQAEVSVRVAPWASDITVWTLAPKDDAEYEHEIVRVTCDPILAGVTNIRDPSVALIDVGEWRNWHVEMDYNFRHGFVSRHSLTAMPPSPNIRHTNPGQHTFVFHLGLRLSDTDSMAYPVIMDGSMVDAETEGRMFDLGEDTTDRIVFLGTGVLRLAVDYAATGKVDFAFHTADMSPLFTLSTHTYLDKEGKVVGVKDFSPPDADSLASTGIPTPEQLDRTKERLRNMAPGENPLDVMLECFGKETGKDVSGLRNMLGLGDMTPGEGADMLGKLLFVGLLGKLGKMG